MPKQHKPAPHPITSAEKQRRRRALLNAIARAAGWPTWAKFETAIIHQIANMPKADAPTIDGEIPPRPEQA